MTVRNKYCTSLHLLSRFKVYCGVHRHRSHYSLRPSLNASWSTTSGVVLEAGVFFFAATARNSENPGMAPGWLIPGERLKFLLASLSLAACAETLRPAPSAPVPAPVRPPPHGRQPTHFPSLDDSGPVGAKTCLTDGSGDCRPEMARSCRVVKRCFSWHCPVIVAVAR